MRIMAQTPEIFRDRAERLAESGVISGGRLRLRTLILIRWVAAAGQTATVLSIYFGFGFPLPLYWCLGVIATLMLSNLVLAGRETRRARLDDPTAALLLGFDVVQLAALLYLTGGLQNPFAILIIAPVAVSATLLSRKATAVLTLLAISSVSLLAYFRLALPWTGAVLELPDVYILGIWTALAVASVFISTYVWSVAEEARRMVEALAAAQTLLARQQRISALGGLAAAAAHELGSPLATIAVVAKELSRDVPRDSPLADDVELLLSQSDRCRDILAGLSRAPESQGGGFDRLPLRQAVEAAAEPHLQEKVAFRVAVTDDAEGAEPRVNQSPEFLSGLGALLQNAFQFAIDEVDVKLSWDSTWVVIAIHDDFTGARWRP
jgi:two-component system sensor histidine kinase RegB